MTDRRIGLAFCMLVGCGARVEPEYGPDQSGVSDGGVTDSAVVKDTAPPASDSSVMTDCGTPPTGKPCSSPACASTTAEAERTIACIADVCTPGWCGTIKVQMMEPATGYICRNAFEYVGGEGFGCFQERIALLNFAGCADKNTTISVTRPCR